MTALAFLAGGIVALVLRKFITKQPLLKASVDSWVDKASAAYKSKVRD